MPYSRAISFVPSAVGIAIVADPRTLDIDVWCAGYGPREGYAVSVSSDTLVNCTYSLALVAVPNGARYWGGPAGDPTTENPIYNGLTGIDPDRLMYLHVTITPTGGAPAGALTFVAAKGGVVHDQCVITVSGGVASDLVLDTMHGPDGALSGHAPDLQPAIPPGQIAGYHGRGAFGNVISGNTFVTGGNEGSVMWQRLYAGRQPLMSIHLDALRKANVAGGYAGLMLRASAVPGNSDTGVNGLYVYWDTVSAALMSTNWGQVEGGVTIHAEGLSTPPWALGTRARLRMDVKGADVYFWVADPDTGANPVACGHVVLATQYEDDLHRYIGFMTRHYTDCLEASRFGIEEPAIGANLAVVEFTMVEGAAPPAASGFALAVTPPLFPAAGLGSAVAYVGSASGWLAAVLDGPALPTSVTLTPTAAASLLEPGDHEAVVSVTSDLGGDPTEVTVVLHVTPLPPIACEERLDVYEADRTTVAWSVSTNPAHLRPYLVEAEGGDSQEIDAAEGHASIGTLRVLVIDKALIPGDQDSGWLTARLTDVDGTPAVAGRRCRLRRYIPGVGWRLLADGPAGFPSLDSSYAAYGWEIRDTREGERALPAFTDGTYGGTTLLPEGALNGYGHEGSTYLVAPTTPAIGVVTARNGLGVPGVHTVCLGFGAEVGRAEPYPVIFGASWQAMLGDTVALEPLAISDLSFVIGPLRFWALKYHGRVEFGSRLRLRWRPYPGGGAWHELLATLVIDQEMVTPAPLPAGSSCPWAALAPSAAWLAQYPVPPALPSMSDTNWNDLKDIMLGGLVANGPPNAPPGDDGLPVHWLVFGDGDAADVPALGQTVELVVISNLPPSAAQPITIEGWTAGEYARNCYDGLYSPRDDAGAVIPTGIRYDAAAVLQMTEPVRMRLTAPIEDVREHLEKAIYGPLGWIPALDGEGRISPLSQVPPVSTEGLPVVSDVNSEPAPDWDQGDRVVNLLRFTYPRDYVPTDPKDAEASDGVSSKTQVIEYQDLASIAAHNEQKLELDGSAFRAISAAGNGATADLTAERGQQLARDRERYIGDRYARGAPAIKLFIMQEEFPTLRAGDWVVLNLSWVPDPLTGRRGLLALAQVMRLGDPSCAWREALFECAAPATS